VCFGILPIWGAQTLAALAVAEWLRPNRALVLAGSNISFGTMSVVIIGASTLVGRAIRSADPSVLFDIPNDTAQFEAWIGEYLLGSLVLAGAAGVTFGGLAFVIAMIAKRASAHRPGAGEP
jgi:uncharacterized protein (DUF2062 family)